MKKLMLVLALVSIGADASYSGVRNLIDRINQKVEMLAETPLLRLLPSQDGKPKQGEAFTVFAQPDSKYLKANALLSATLDGQPVVLDAPSADFWVFTHPGFNEIRTHTMVWAAHLEDSDEAAEIRAALKLLDKEITALQKKIDTTPPGSVRDGYIQQRDEKIALKNELLLALERLKTFVGTQEMTFEVVANSEGASFPRISSVLPNVGSVNGGTVVTLSGANFVGTPSVEIGGFSVSAQLISATEVQFTTPAFGTLGAKDVSVSFPQGDGSIKNAILKNAFFAGVEPAPMPNFAPQASAGNSQVIALGATASLLGTSFDANGDALSHVWTVISVADGSQIVPGSQLSASDAASFTPDYPGIYVLGYQVTESATQDHLQSPVSLTTVRANPPANRAPEISLNPASLSLTTGQTATVSVSTSDPDFWQRRTVLITSYPQGATVTSFDGATLTIQAGSQAASTQMQLAVIDNGEYPQTTFVNLPIVVSQPNTPPTISSVAAAQLSEGFPLQMRWSAVASDSNGINRYRWLFGDGFSGFGSTVANQFGSSVHDYVTAGPFSVQVFVRDTLGAESSATSSLDLTARATNKRPVSRVTASAISGAAPLTVTFNGSASFDTDGTINVVRWNFGDGTSELQGGSELLTTIKTFNTNGTYNVRFRIRDNLNAETDHFIAIYVGTTPPAGGTAPTADYVPTPRQVTLGSSVAFDAARSNDPNPSAGPIANYAWSVQDAVTCAGQPSNTCSYSGQTTNHTYGAVGNYFPSLAVTGSGGTTSSLRIVEVHVVNQGQAPRAYFTASATSGAVPLTVNFDSSNGLSGDFDGTIQSHLWDFGTGTSSLESPSFQFTVPGVYFVNHTVTDNDGNKHTASQMITANASLRAKSTANDDEERAERRALLTNACGQGQGEACYWLGKMHEEDGDAPIAQKLFERACQLGHTAACSITPWLKW